MLFIDLIYFLNTSNLNIIIYLFVLDENWKYLNDCALLELEGVWSPPSLSRLIRASLTQGRFNAVRKKEERRILSIILRRSFFLSKSLFHVDVVGFACVDAVE